VATAAEVPARNERRFMESLLSLEGNADLECAP